MIGQFNTLIRKGKECCSNVISRVFGNERYVTRKRRPSRETTINTMSSTIWSWRHYIVMTLVVTIFVFSNPVNTDTEGAIEGVRINGVAVLSGSCYWSKKYRISSNNSRGRLFFFSHQTGRLFHQKSCPKYFVLLSYCFISVPNLVLWLIFNFHIPDVRAWIVTDQFVAASDPTIALLVNHFVNFWLDREEIK